MSSSARGTTRHRRLLGPRHVRHPRRPRPAAPRLRRERRHRRLRVGGGRPDLARDSAGTEAAARQLHEAIAEPNLYVKIPGTAEGIAPIRAMIAEGRSINVTLIFSLDRYAEVMEAYLSRPGGGARATSAASRAWPASSSPASTPRSTAASRPSAPTPPWPSAARPRSPRPRSPTSGSWSTFQGPRWDALAARGARVQRPLWASTSTKNPAYPDTAYVDRLIGPDTVNTMPEETIDAFLDHGTVRPHGRRRPGGGRRHARPPWRTSGSTSTTSARCSRTRASPPSRSRSTSSSGPSRPRPSSWGRAERRCTVTSSSSTTYRASSPSG